MGLWETLKSLFLGDNREQIYWLQVRCRKCGELITSRLNLTSDLSVRDEGGYIVRKTLMGELLCFERIEVTLIFDRNWELVERSIQGGEFVDPVDPAEVEA